MSSETDPIARVAAGYDQVGEAYFQYYRAAPSEVVTRYENLFIDQVTPGGSVLELGCGNGLPMTANLAEKFHVTGVDFSAGQIDRARRNVSGPTFIHADMTTVEFPDGTFDGIAACYSIIHVPRDLHGDLFHSIFSWLKPGGLFMATLNSTPDEGSYEDDWFGAPMYWSGFDVDTSRQMITDTGFETVSERVEVSDDPESDREKEIHLWIVARRPA
jgi:SAM-dependent methyltransferase